MRQEAKSHFAKPIPPSVIYARMNEMGKAIKARYGKLPSIYSSSGRTGYMLERYLREKGIPFKASDHYYTKLRLALNFIENRIGG